MSKSLDLNNSVNICYKDFCVKTSMTNVLKLSFGVLCIAAAISLLKKN